MNLSLLPLIQMNTKNMASELEHIFLNEIRQHQGILGKICWLYADSAEDRDDLRQEIMLQAWKSFPRFEGKSKFSTWLYQVGLNTALTIRKKRRITTTDIDASYNISSEEPNVDDAQRLLLAMKRLPEAERMILTLHLEGYKNQEIAEMLGTTPNNLNVKLHRSKQQVKKMLQPL